MRDQPVVRAEHVERATPQDWFRLFWWVSTIAAAVIAVVCRSVDLETGTEKINSHGFTGTYFVPLTIAIPVGSLIALRRTRATARPQRTARTA